MKNKKKFPLQPKALTFTSGVAVGIAALALIEWGVGTISLKRGMSTGNGQSLYMIGQYYARQMEDMRLSGAEAKLVARGLQDWAGKKTSLIDYESHRPLLRAFQENRQQAQLAAASLESSAYLKDFIKAGGSRSISGLAFKIIAPGNAKKPTLHDRVEVKYRASLLNGKLVDATDEDQRKTVELPMNGVIPGWSEGLQLIGEGGEIDLVVPAHLAYGQEGNANVIPPGATLLFRVKLVKIAKL